MAMQRTTSVLVVIGFSVSFATCSRQLLSVVNRHRDSGGLSLCRVAGPDGSGLTWHFGTENCKMTCRQTIFTKGKINGAFADKFIASKEKGACYCRDKDTGKAKLPPHGVMNRCGKADCWEYYRNVMSKVVDLPSVNFWSADQECELCGEVDQPRCDETLIDRSFGGDDLKEMKIAAQADKTGKKQKELDIILDALKQEGIEVASTIATPTIADEFRWVTLEDLKCSKQCADENGPGMQVGEYVCQKLAGDSSTATWERVGDSECEHEVGAKPGLGVCATTVCRAAWTCVTDLDNELETMQQKLNDEAKSALPEGIKPGWDPSLIDVTDLMDRIEEKGLRCCCDKDKTGLGGYRDTLLRGISERSKYCALSGESKCGNVVVTEGTEKAHVYDSTDGRCEILKSTLDELKDMIDVTEPELVSAISDGTWQPCSHGCLQKDEIPEDAKQSRSVQCVVENGPGNWETRDAEACEKLIPSATKPVDQRTCEPEPPRCFKWVVTTQCQDHEGNVMEDAKCDGLKKP